MNVIFYSFFCYRTETLIGTDLYRESITLDESDSLFISSTYPGMLVIFTHFKNCIISIFEQETKLAKFVKIDEFSYPTYKTAFRFQKYGNITVLAVNKTEFTFSAISYLQNESIFISTYQNEPVKFNRDSFNSHNSFKLIFGGFGSIKYNVETKFQDEKIQLSLNLPYTIFRGKSKLAKISSFEGFFHFIGNRTFSKSDIFKVEPFIEEASDVLFSGFLPLNGSNEDQTLVSESTSSILIAIFVVLSFIIILSVFGYYCLCKQRKSEYTQLEISSLS